MDYVYLSGNFGPGRGGGERGPEPDQSTRPVKGTFWYPNYCTYGNKFSCWMLTTQTWLGIRLFDVFRNLSVVMKTDIFATILSLVSRRAV